MKEVPVIRAIVGLGNPTRTLAGTRHNVGFAVLEELLREGFVEEKPSASGLIGVIAGFFGRAKGVDTRCWAPVPGGSGCCIRLDGHALELFRPGFYMNRSGEALKLFLEFKNIELDEILVIVDDIDLPLGTIRLKRSGGPGSHNGLKNINDILGPEYPRLRIGIRSTADPGDLAAFVLSPFAPEESAGARKGITLAAAAVRSILAEGFAAAMNQFNRKS